MASVLLINLNRVQIPLVAPYALDVLGSALAEGGHDVEVLDLNLASDPLQAIDARLGGDVPDLVGVTLRNTGDLYFPSWLDLPSRGSFLPDHAVLLARILHHVDADRIVMGGVGFSSNPIPLLQRFGLRRGVVGPGEAVIRALADAIDRGARLDTVPGERIAAPAGLTLMRGPRGYLASRVRRTFVNNRHYYDAGGLSGLRTSNGCGMMCSYCVEPNAKGHTYTRRTVDDVVFEIDQLLEAGIHDIHTCDSEFNLPIDHAKRVLTAIAERRYPRLLRFWAYGQPKPFDAELARLMAKANVIGVDFGIDHTNQAMLQRLGKSWYTFDDVRRTTMLCQDHGIAVNHELLFGYPGDSPDKMFTAIDDVLGLGTHAVGVVVGLAVPAGTRLAAIYEHRIARREALDGFYASGEPLTDPMFYVDPSFEVPAVFAQIARHVGAETRRVMIPQVNSTAALNNQLVGSERIRQDLAAGKRGAYWYHYPAAATEAAAAPMALSSATSLP